MARQGKVPKGTSVALDAPSRRGRWVWSVLLIMLGLLLAVAFLHYHPDQSHRNVAGGPPETNLVGLFGAEASYFTFLWFGRISFLIPFLFFWFSWILLQRKYRQKTFRILLAPPVLFSLAGFAAMHESFFSVSEKFPAGSGGWLGTFLYESLLLQPVGEFGSAVIFLGVALAGLTYILVHDVPEWFVQTRQSLSRWWQGYLARREERKKEKALLREKRAKEKEAKRLAKEKAKAQKEKAREEARQAKEAARAEALARKQPGPAAPAAGQAGLNPFYSGTGEAGPIVPPSPVKTSAAETKRREELPPIPAPAMEKSPGADLSGTLQIITPEQTRKAAQPMVRTAGDFEFPTLELLDETPPPARENTDQEHARNAETLLRVLKEFSVEVSLGEIHIGPVITRYELYPAPGVRVEKIANLDKNIALGMRAQSVRILAPVPGKGCVGVEVPNKYPSPVGIREILESEDWVNAKAEIPIALGRDVGGKPLISDLTRMPHLLIAGATGSGKTVCINSIITSLLYHSSPDRLRFLMVDPKIVEMKIFNTLPHMLIPVVTEPKKVPRALKYLISEMERRYQYFAKVGVRNITGFNNRHHSETEKFPQVGDNGEEGEVKAGQLELLDEFGQPIPDHLPYIVAIIDELADLMMVAPADIETGIARLAQLARAAGIHLIIATQRPSVNVITGVIKANLPCRIAFQVASKIDSRTILDGGGAEQLIGRGDMLFSPPGTSRLIRSQGAYVSDDEISRIVEFLKRNGPPDYSEEIQKHLDKADDEAGSGGGSDEEEGGDEMLDKAIEVIRSSKRASTSMLQRRLSIGYNRAARIMDLLEDKGIVGPENGSSPREILVDLDEL